MTLEKSETSKKPLTTFLLVDATPCTGQGLEASTTQVNIHSRPTNRLNQSLKQLPESAFTHYNIEPVIAGYKLVCPLHSSLRTGVFYAKELNGEREVVIKRFSEYDQEQFDRERAIQKVLKEKGDHKNLLLADEFLDKQRIVISPYARGGDLRNLQKREGKLTPRQTRSIVSGLCDALDYLHEKGIVHRDIKSRNVVLDIADPVLEKITAQELESSLEITPKLLDYEMSWHESVAYLDMPGMAMGTLYYMAPEAYKGEKCDLRLDIYAFGVTLYQLLADQYPFIGDNNIQVSQHLDAPFSDITRYNSEVTEGLQRVIEKALAKNPDERYQSARELKRDYLAVVGLKL